MEKHLNFGRHENTSFHDRNWRTIANYNVQESRSPAKSVISIFSVGVGTVGVAAVDVVAVGFVALI